MKRKSNFDVTPEEFAAMKQQVQAVAAAAMQQQPGMQQGVVQQYGMGASYSMTPAYAQPPPRPLHDQRYNDKLEAALQRSFDFVRRLDAIAAGLIPGPAVVAPVMFSRQRTQLNRPRPVRARPGIGSAAHKQNDRQAASVYVAGLPPNFSQTQLEGLFSAYGKVTRCKIYKDEQGVPKGDALVTFAKPTSATNACKMNGFGISPEHVLSVTPADFSRKQREELKLPPECEAETYPVVLFKNMYITADAESDPNFFIELEADLLEACVKFGQIRRVVSPDGDAFEGAIAVTFVEEEAARKCAEAMDGRFFDGREVETELVGEFWIKPGPESREQPGESVESVGADDAASLRTQAAEEAATPAASAAPTGTIVVAPAPPNVRSTDPEPAEDPLAAFFESIGELEKTIS